MNEQTDLFDPRRVSQTHSETSLAAAESIDSVTLKAKALHFFKQEVFGATDEQLAAYLGCRRTTAGARRIELMDAGRVEDSGIKRHNSSGRLAVVWRLCGNE